MTVSKPHMTNRRAIVAGAAILFGAGCAPLARALPLRSNPPTLPPPVGFSHLSEGRGRLVWISGQVPRRPDGSLVGKGDFAAQVEQVFQNLDIAVREAGGRFADIVKLNYYCHQGVDRRLLGNVNRVRDRYVDVARPPASTFVFVAGLALPDWLIEVEAVLALPDAVSVPAAQEVAVQARLISVAPISPRLLTAAQAMCRATRTEPGCIDYRIGVDVEHHNILLLSEKWRNEAALVAHFGTPHMADFRAALRAEGEIKTEIDVRGVSAPRSLDFSGGQVRIAG